MARLSLKRTKEGSPYRLILTCSYAERHKAKKGGLGQASWAKETGVWTFPADPRVVEGLYNEFGDRLELTEEMDLWLDALIEHQEQVLQASVDESEYPIPNLPDVLRPYQRSSIRYLLAAKRAILGHDMGVGKTVIGAITATEANLNRVLIVAPYGAKFHWAKHMVDWAGWAKEEIWILDPTLHEDWQIVRQIGPQRIKHINEVIKKSRFCLIITYNMADAMEEQLTKHTYDIIMFDEAHRLKNKKTQRTKAGIKLSRLCEYLFLITGTPVRNDYDDLWTLLHMISPYRFSSYWSFLQSYMFTEEGYWGGVEIMGLRDQSKWDEMMSVFMLRKQKEDILPDLPDKIYVDLEVSMQPQQAKAYRDMEDEMVMEMVRANEDGEENFANFLRASTTIAKLIRLRQICLTPHIIDGTQQSGKLIALQELFDELSETGEQAVVFTMFAEFIPYLHRLLEEAKVSYDTIQGSTSASGRRYAEEKLNHGDIQVIVGTIGAMGESLNLQAATTAIFCDLDWVPASNEQAEDRIHRLGIKTSPRIIKLYHPNSVESDIRLTLERKEKMELKAVGGVEIARAILARREQPK